MNVTLTPGWLRGNHVLRTLDLDAPGVDPATALSTVGVARLPTDAIGNFTLALNSLVAGSAIRVETTAGALVEFRVAAGATEVFNVPAFAPGNPSNDLRIKVRKGTSAPFYIPYETLTTASVGSASIFVSQTPDE